MARDTRCCAALSCAALSTRQAGWHGRRVRAYTWHYKPAAWRPQPPPAGCLLCPPQPSLVHCPPPPWAAHPCLQLLGGLVGEEQLELMASSLLGQALAAGGGLN